MTEYFECSTSFEGLDKNGKEKTMKELCLIQAISYTDAEAFANNEYKAQINCGDLAIDKLAKVKIANIIRDGNAEDTWYKVTITYTDDNNKGTNQVVMVQSNTFEAVLGIIKNYEKETVLDWEIIKIEKSKVVEVHKCETDLTGKLLD